MYNKRIFICQKQKKVREREREYLLPKTIPTALHDLSYTWTNQTRASFVAASRAGLITSKFNIWLQIIVTRLYIYTYIDTCSSLLCMFGYIYNTHSSRHPHLQLTNSKIISPHLSTTFLLSICIKCDIHRYKIWSLII